MVKIILAALPLAILLDLMVCALQQNNMIPNFGPIVTGVGTFTVSLVLLLGVTQDL